MLSRLVMSSPMLSATIVRSAVQKIPLRTQICRKFGQDSRQTFQTRADRIPTKRKTLKEWATEPAGPNAFAIGKGALAGGSLLGIGALAFYGLGLSGDSNTIMNNSMVWPEYIRQRIHSTYAYFGGSIAITAVSAAAIFRSPTLFNIVARSGWVSILISMAAMIGSGMVARSIPYGEGFGAKQLAWAVHCGVLGAVIAPLSLVGGPILLRAAWYTAGIVGGLSTVAVCAPSDRFLYMGGPLAIGLGVVFASSVGSMFLPPSTVLGAGLYSMALYGGLLLFSAFLLYDTQRLVKVAEHHPQYAAQRYDPINASMSIYLDTINIFIRIVSILAGQGGNRRR